jgi:hypothetical protein
MAALFQLVYMSSLVTDGPELLPAILDAAVKNNKRKFITGMLLYADGCVMQVLEGERNTVLETFHSIELDKRHSGIFVLIQQEIDARQFASWSMGFRQLTAADLEKFPAAAHVFKARQDEILLRSRSGAARSILQSFAEGSIGLI